MATAVVLGSVCVAWLVYAGVLAQVMGHRGHRRLTWWLLAAATGPVAAAIAAIAVRRGERPACEQVVAGGAGDGPVRIVVGIDGSPASARAAGAAASLLGRRLGRCTMIAVVDFDTGLDDGREQRRLRASLRELAGAWGRTGAGPAVPAAELRTGPAAQVLARAADDADLLVLGRRPRAGDDGPDLALVLAGRSRVPILIGPPPCPSPELADIPRRSH